MKLTKLLSLVFVALFYSQVQAQDFTLSFSEPLKVSTSSSISTSGRIGDKLYVTKADSKKNVYSLLIYDRTLKLEKEFIFKQPNCKGISNCINKNFDYERTLFFKDKILLFFDTYEKDSKTRMLFCQQVSLDGQFIGNLTEIDRISAKKKSNSGNFKIEASEDSTKFVVIQNPPYEKKADEKFLFKVYNGNLENLSNSAITLPFKDKDVAIDDYYISNKGDIYMLLNIAIEKKKKAKGQDDEYYSLLCLNSSTDNSLADYRLQIPNRNIVDISIRVDNKNNTVLCSGFYSDIKSSAKWAFDLDGFFHLNVDVKSQKILSQSYKNISDDLVKQLNGQREDKEIKDTKGVRGTFKIRDQVIRSDGSSMIVAESRWVRAVERCRTSSNGVTICTTNYYYYRNNIFVIAISSEGEVQAFYDIPKKQLSVNDNGLYSSFMLIEKDDRIFFIYNDNPKNMDPEMTTIRDVKLFKLPKSGILVATELLPDGRYTKQLLVSNKERKMVARLEGGFKVDNGVYICPITTFPKFTKLSFIRFEVK